VRTNKTAAAVKILKLFGYLGFAGIAILLFTNIKDVYAVDLGTNFVTNTIDFATADPRVAIMELVRLALTFLGIIAVVMVMYAGYLWTVSGGNEEKISRAKKTLINAIIGLVIIVSAFVIVNFVIGKLNSSLTAGGGPGGGGGPGSLSGGIGALGNCAIESVYPEPGQKDVPRNTGIIVTFMEEVDPVSVCGVNPCSGNNIIADGRIKLYKSASDASNPANWITDVAVSSSDNRTFFFDPADNLGSPMEIIWYSVYLSNDIQKLDGSGGIFDACGFTRDFEWKFEVSTRLDLTPPQVVSVFPPPDDAQDTSAMASPQLAEGAITVTGAPAAYSPAGVAGVINTGGGTWSTAVAAAGNSCAEDGLRVTVTGSLGTELRRISDGVLLGAGTISGGNTSVSFSTCNLVLTINSGDFVSECAGNCQWDVNLNPMVTGDRLTVGSINYVFVGGAPSGNQILLGATPAATAANINAALAGNSAVISSAAGAAVAIQAASAGQTGNNIALTTNSPALTLSPGSGHLEGGVNGGVTVTTVGLPDQPRNAIIKITFNEAVNPSTVSGDATALNSYIRVVDMDTGGNLGGRFMISNGYRTVEFRSDNVCGVNGCGEPIYCLPANSHLRVEVEAARLAACPVPLDCSTVSPYTNCTGGHCQDASGDNYPMAGAPLDGIADTANNSLDGNRDDNAIGPGASFYDENSDSGTGDSYQWSFYISGELDLTPPVITSLSPAHNDSGVAVTDPVLIGFNYPGTHLKIMMSGSLRAGSVVIFDGRNNVTHRLVNLRSLADRPVGYWVVSDDIDITGDGVADYTQATVRHADFPESVTFRAQVGSGVKDIYQNCFRPSSSSGPSVCNGNPSCCGNTPTAGSTCP